MKSKERRYRIPSTYKGIQVAFQVAPFNFLQLIKITKARSKNSQDDKMQKSILLLTEQLFDRYWIYRYEILDLKIFFKIILKLHLLLYFSFVYKTI